MMQMAKRIYAYAAIFLIFLTGVSHAQSEYRVQPGDTLVIEVLEDTTLNRAVVVLPDGRFSFPFAGSLSAAGRTVGQIQNAVTSAIANQFAAEPTVFVSVQPLDRFVLPTEPVADTIDIYFVGEVNTPGLREVRPGTTFLQAVAQSGGLTRFAATKRIQLRRTGASGAQSVTTINYRALSNGASLENDITLVDGDVILVPERRLFE